MPMYALCQKRTFSLSLNGQSFIRIKADEMHVQQSGFQVIRG